MVSSLAARSPSVAHDGERSGRGTRIDAREPLRDTDFQRWKAHLAGQNRRSDVVTMRVGAYLESSRLEDGAE